MNLIHLLKGKDFRHHEQLGDTRSAARAWGKARLEYEAALSKALKDKLPQAEKAAIIRRLESKIRDSEEALASEHVQSGEEMMAAEYFDDAREYFELALTLTKSSVLADTARDRLKQAESHLAGEPQTDLFEIDEPDTSRKSEHEGGGDDAYFTALCNTLPDDVSDAYLSYGAEFQNGYMALNRGDFQAAAEALQKALEENPDPASFIRLELATAYLNLERFQDVRELLEGFLVCRPDVLPAYELLCEVFWETGEFDAA